MNSQLKTAEISKNIAETIRSRHLDVFKSISLSFYIELHTEREAKSFANALEFQGFDTDIDAFQQDSQKWRCWANIKLVPNKQNLSWIEILLNSQCHEYHGELVSWETNPFESGQELGQMLARFEMQYRQAVNI